MTRECVHDGRRAEDSLSRFKDRTVLVAVGLLGLVLLVFAAGMAAEYYSAYPYAVGAW